MTISKTGLAIGACAAACAAPMLFSSLFAGVTIAGFSASALFGGEAESLALLAIAIGGYFLWRRQAARKSACHCGPDTGTDDGLTDGAQCRVPAQNPQ